MAQQALSPLVQVTHTPSFVYSHLQIAKARLHWHRHMPFIVQQQLHMPSHSILQRFCSVAQATSSSQMHLIFIPPVHFSIFIVHRGRTIDPAMPGIELWDDGSDMSAVPACPNIARHAQTPFSNRFSRRQPKDQSESFQKLPPQGLCAPPVKPVSDAVRDFCVESSRSRVGTNRWRNIKTAQVNLQ